jgi:hypothetical protein
LRHLVLFAIASLLVPTVVQASCGDYVIVNGRSTAKHDRTTDVATTPATPIRLCHGPNCDQPPPVQQAAPELLPRSIRVERTAVNVIRLSAFPPDSEYFPYQEPLRATADPIHDIFHPPRI